MTKLAAPAMVYIAGEEMTREMMKMIMEQWIAPYIDTSKWQFFDLSCKHRDATDDQVLRDAIAAGAQVGAIFKEPTITPTADQVKSMGLSKPYPSPNGKMRAGWNGYSIDRDTIRVAGLESQMGYENPVLFCRHAVGGEYGAGAAIVGKGTLKTVFTGEDGKEQIVDERKLIDSKNAAVTYHNPYDNVEMLAHHFFKRALAANVTPYVITKKTVFKWQEPFWQIMKDVFDAHYKAEFTKKELLKWTQGELRHMLSDDAAMKLAKWKQGNFAMVAHNYDGDWLTDELAEIYKSPGFISSTLTGVKADGSKIMEFEASHGTVTDHYRRFLNGEETSVNPLGMVYALRGAMDHSVTLAGGDEKIRSFSKAMYDAMCEAMAEGKGTRDLSGPTGLTTDGFVAEVAGRLKKKL